MTDEPREGLRNDHSGNLKTQEREPVRPRKDQSEQKEPTSPQSTFNSKDPLRFFNHLAERKEALARLNALAEAHSLRTHGQLTPSEFMDAQQQWNNKMSEWAKQMDQIDPKLFKQIRTVANYISTPPQTGREPGPDQEVDWIAFYDNLYKTPGAGSVETFVARLKTMPGIRENAKGMEALSRMFGPEVHDRLFGVETQAEAHENRDERSREAVENAFNKGKIDEAKKDQLLKKIDERAENLDFLVNNVEIDSKFTAEEKIQIQKMLHNIPPELLRNIARVYQLKEDHSGAGSHKATISGEASEIGIRSSALKYSEENAKRGLDNSETEGVFYHEILGHALRRYISKASKELNQQTIDLLTRVPNDLLIKDIYAKQYVDDDPKLSHMNVPRDGIAAEVDEFWADRMGEWWGKRNGQAVSLSRTDDNPFSAAEQMYIDGVCQQIFEIYERAVDHRRKRPHPNKLLGQLPGTTR